MVRAGPVGDGRHVGRTSDGTDAATDTDERTGRAQRLDPWWRTPAWWATLLVQAAGVYSAYFCLIVAAFTLPADGLWGDPNDAGTRAIGALAALAAGPAFLAGPLFVGMVREDRRWLIPAGVVAAVLSAGLALSLVAS
jgi:hypothetical protein